MSYTNVTIIFAASIDNAIGKENRLLWVIPEDLKRFKELTTGNVILMGRKTFESIGRPLPNRTNVIITRNPDYQVPEGCVVFGSITEALDNYKDEHVYIIGGSEIYKQSYQYADKILYTLVLNRYPDADAFIDPEDFNDFELGKMTRHHSEKQGLDYVIYELKRCQEKR